MGGNPKHRIWDVWTVFTTMARCASGTKLLIASLLVLQCAVAMRHGLRAPAGLGACTTYREVERKYHAACDKLVIKGVHIPFERSIDVTKTVIKTYIINVCKFADKLERCIDTTFKTCPADIRKMLHMEHPRRGWMCMGHAPAIWLKEYIVNRFHTIPNACVKRVKTAVFTACPVTSLASTDDQETFRHRIVRLKRRDTEWFRCVKNYLKMNLVKKRECTGTSWKDVLLVSMMMKPFELGSGFKPILPELKHILYTKH